MSSRIHLYLERLSLDELLYLEQEIERRKLRFRREYYVLAVQTEQRLLTTMRGDQLHQVTREMRRHINECTAAGSGVQLAYSPDSSLLLFRELKGAVETSTRLLTGIADVNGKLGNGTSIGLKLGLASGEDVLAPGSVRCLRSSALVKRASQCAWKSPSGALLIDDRTAQRWEPRQDPMRLPIEIDGGSVFRVVPGGMKTNSFDAEEDRLKDFLNLAVSRSISTLKYSLLREEARDTSGSAWAKPVARAVINIEAFDSQSLKNITFTTKCALSEYAEHVDRIRRMVSDRGLGLVKHEEASIISA
ncbi:MAG: hypothetical protein IPG71_12260 [bacterium]|nr:hypothetical protein [bacterium]